MKTGFSNARQEQDDMQNRYSQAMFDVCRPVFEQAVVLAGKYANACQRDILLVEDFKLAMKYCVMHRVGCTTESLFPEFEDDEDPEDDIELEFEEEDVDEGAWTPYEGDDPVLKRMTNANEEYKTWTPSNPAEEFLKSALDAHEIE
jgi:hypothetical protein